MPNQPKRKARTIRVSDELWEAAAAKAAANDESLSDAIRKFLRRYTK